MIVNTDIPNVLRPPPKLDARWREKIVDWLDVAFGNSYQPAFTLQLELVEQILAVESEIATLRSDAKALGVQISFLKTEGNLQLIPEVQREATILAEQAKQKSYLRNCLLLIGDHIAARMLDPDTIRRFANYQSPGFLSKKDGLKVEIEAARHFFGQGYMVILNDLTHSLRVGDLTLKKGSEVRTFEVKTSFQAYRSPEALRQMMIPIAVHDYIKSDVLTMPHRLSGEQGLATLGVRLDSHINEDLHLNIAGNIYKTLRNEDVGHLRIGAKSYLFAARRHVDKLRFRLENLTADGAWVVSNVQRRVVDYAEVSPFTQWFKPESALEIMAGDVIVLCAFKMADLESLFAAKGLKLVWKRKMTDLFPIRFDGDLVSAPKVTHKTDNMGDHHRLKLMYAFLAVESYVDIIAFLLSPEAAAQAQAKVSRFLPTKLNDEPPKTIQDTESLE